MPGYDILDTAFLLRWDELVADGRGPEELPSLRRPFTNEADDGARPGWASSVDLSRFRLPNAR